MRIEASRVLRHVAAASLLIGTLVTNHVSASQASTREPEKGVVKRSFDAVINAVQRVVTRVKHVGGASRLTHASMTAAASDPISLETSGGGWFTLTLPPITGSEANFGLVATKTMSGVVEGHFNYYNRTTGLHVNGPIDDATLDAPAACGPNVSSTSLRFSGHCEDFSCSFEVEVVDNGDPGRRNDKICRISVTGFNNRKEPLADVEGDRLLNGGNIQIRTGAGL